MRHELTDDDLREPNEDGKILKYPSLKGLEILRTYYWFIDLQGRLKQDISPPGEYHGRPRMFIREDIVRDIEDPTLLTSHMRVYSGKKLLAYDTKTIPEYKKVRRENPFLTEYDSDDSGLRNEIRMFALSMLLNDGWMNYRIEDLDINKSRRKSKKAKPSIRKLAKNIKKPVKKINKKVKKVVRKKKR
jgi:hypothetical protein